MSTNPVTTDVKPDEMNGITASKRARANDLAGRHPFNLTFEHQQGHDSSEIVFKSLDVMTGVLKWNVRVVPVKRGPGDTITGFTVIKHHAHEQPIKGVIIEENTAFTNALETADKTMTQLTQ